MYNWENKRDEELIKEREEYEKEFFSQIVDEMMESDALDILIANRFEYIDDHFEFEPSPGYDYLEELYYAEYDNKFQEKISDVDDYIDYPEGLDENLDGIRYNEPYEEFNDDYDDFVELQIELEIEKFEKQQLDEVYEDQYNDYDPGEVYEQLVIDVIIDEHDEEEKYLEQLIKEHLEEEKDFFENQLIGSILEDNLFERAIDELIFDEIDIDYEPSYFDYNNADENWYDNHNPSDELLTEPFNSLGDIDYPEGEPIHSYDIPNENFYDDELQRDFEEFERKKQATLGFKEEDIPIPDDELIIEPPEDIEYDYEDIEDKRNEELIKNQEKIDSLFKDYFTKDDTLDIIIKEKLKEKKFKK